MKVCFTAVRKTRIVASFYKMHKSYGMARKERSFLL